MSNYLAGVNLLFALAVGMLTFVVSKWVLKTCPMLNNPVIPFCVAGFTMILLGSASNTSRLLLPYGALGLALLFSFLLCPFLNDKKPKIKKPPLESRKTGKKEDPWEKEMRRRRQVVRRRILK